MTRDKGGLAWISLQVLRMSAQTVSRSPRGPSPLGGHFRVGSTTEVVFQWLSAKGRSRVYWTREAIVKGTGRTEKSVDWALIFLRQVKAVEVTTDPRSGRYHRYRVVEGAMPSPLPVRSR